MHEPSLYTRNSFALAVIILFSFGLFSWVFKADYLYLDEAYALWHNRLTYLQYAGEGRLFAGLFFSKLFSLVDTAADMKYLRILSFFGWIASSVSLYYISKKWITKLNLNKYLPLLLAVFCICSSAVSIYIGWASCAQIFLAFLPALFGSHLFFTALMDQQSGKIFRGLKISGAIILGVISLLFYQSAFGIFILPVLLIWITKDIPGRNKKMLTAILVYLLTYLIYYFAFKYYLTLLDINQGTRTGFAPDPVKKIGFFFSALTQAWNLNLLLNLHSIVSQAIPIVLFVVWLVLFIRQSAPAKMGSILVRIGGILVLLALSYLPPLIIKENFSSYRTLLSLSLCSFSLFTLAVLNSLDKKKRTALFIPAYIVFLFIVGYVNFNNNFIHPLRKEFRSISQLPLLKTIDKNDTIVFIRPAAKSFAALYGIKSHKDEFGLPSTYRDWVPDGLTRQLILEQQSADIARAITIYQFADTTAYADSMRSRLKKPVLIDMNEVLKKQ